MNDLLKELSIRMACLEESGRSVAECRKMADYCLNTADKLPMCLPKWLVDAECLLYEDIEEMVNGLPRVVEAWYNQKQTIAWILAPEAVVAHNGKMALRDKDINATCIYVRTENNIKRNRISGTAILLCPGRFHSLQLAGISRALTAGSKALLLDPDGTASLSHAVRKNDLKRLSFLAARWEIELLRETKNQRFIELLSHFQAMIGGEPV